MKTLEGRPLDFPTLGFLAADWIETYCVRGPGPVQGEPVELVDEDVRFLCWAYRLYPTGYSSELVGRRVVTDADLSAPKGWAKSELAGFIVLWEAFGPCRFEAWAEAGETTHWGYEYEAGEPAGRVLTYPFIRCLATEEEQAGNTYRNVLYVLEHGEAIKRDYRYDAGKTRTIIEETGGGEIRPSTSGDASKDGGLETFVVADETHLYVSQQLHTMYETTERNMRKRRLDEPWLLRTSTSYAPGEDSIAENTWQIFEQLDRDVERALEELGLLVDHREAAEDVDVTDKAALEAALIEVYGDKSHIVDIRNIIRVDFGRPGADIAHARRYFLNQRVKSTGKWVSEKAYKPLETRERLKPGDMIALGFDGSRTQDSTGFVGCRLHDGLLQRLGYWERPPKFPKWREWEVDDDDVHATLEQIMASYRVIRFYADPHWWRQELAVWSGRWPEVTASFDTSKHGRMVYAVDRMETDIGTGAVRFADQSQLRRHFLNAYAVKTKIIIDQQAKRFGVVIAKENRDSRDVIDLAAAAVLANEAKGDAIEKGALEPPPPSEVVFL